MTLSVMSTAWAMGAVVVTALAFWSRRILGDRERYLRAVRGWCESEIVCRLISRVFAAAIRRHGAWGLQRLCRVDAVAMRYSGRAMGTRGFEVLWLAGHRQLHRSRRARRFGAVRRLELAVVVLVMASLGVVAGAIGRLEALHRAP